jgi:regulator of RNase E activity RraA
MDTLNAAISKPKSSEIHPGPGFRFRRKITRPNPETLARLRCFPTPDISDLMNRLYTIDPGIKNLVNEERIFALACTVKVFPGDNLMVNKTLDIAQAGDAVVVDAGSSSLNGVLGDLISTKAKHRGVAAFVIDGLLRDIEGVKEVGMPVYARRVTPIGPLHRGPGEINFPVCCGGIVVRPGRDLWGREWPKNRAAPSDKPTEDCKRTGRRSLWNFLIKLEFTNIAERQRSASGRYGRVARVLLVDPKESQKHSRSAFFFG